MTLTKDELITIVAHGTTSLNAVKEILKNQEDAEKWNEAVRNGIIVTEEDATIYRITDLIEVNDELKKIVERLEKRIEENKKWLIENDKHGSDLHEWYKQKWLENIELQKIMDGKE